jgi:methylmalonyl-CoA mutase cobalamin-binding subunit
MEGSPKVLVCPSIMDITLTEKTGEEIMRVMLGGALGECAHVAGVVNFLRLAEEEGWKTVYLGPAVEIERFIREIKRHDPELVAVSYRLTPETGEALLKRFISAIKREGLEDKRYVFGGTPPVVEKAKELGFFERCFSGEEPLEEIVGYLRGRLTQEAKEEDFPQTFLERLRWKEPYPLLRHHFGLPTLEATAEGISELAEAHVLDVISLGIDQDAQENFYHPERQDPKRAGAGGVPVRTPDDYRRLYQASRRGNYPLMRVYSGTDDQLKLAEMYLETIKNAWCATSLFWFNKLDGRGPLDLEESIRVHQELMRFHAERDIPVEANEPHHWGMRDAPDVIYVVASFLAAYNAKAMGVRDYIAQYMFDSPPGLSDSMDLAKMLACIELSKPLEDGNFRIYRQTRTGLLSYPLDPDRALGQLGASIYLQMAIRPHVVHVVSACEAHHAATPKDIIQSCKVAQWVIKTHLEGAPDLTADPRVQERKEELIEEARLTLEAIREIASPGVEDPWTDAETLARAVKVGILDAPHLKGHPLARGEIITAVVDGASVALDPKTLKPISEWERLERILNPYRR